MKQIIQDHWREKRLPGIDSVTRKDGTVVVLNYYCTDDKNYFVFPLCETTVESLLRYNEDVWTEVQTFTRVVNEYGNIIYHGGEGGMGNEGFVACTDGKDNLNWALFFEHSNPFDKLQLQGQSLIAFSTSGLVYTIDVDNPETIAITSDETHIANRNM